MKTLDVPRLCLIGALMLGIIVAWSAFVPTTVSADESTAIFGGEPNCKCRSTVKDCTTVDDACDEGDYWKCIGPRQGGTCRHATGTPCGTSDNKCKEPSPIQDGFDNCAEPG